MAKRNSIDTSERPQVANDEPESVVDANLTPSIHPQNRKGTEENLNTTTVALPSNGTLNQQTSRPNQPDYYAAARSEMNAATREPSESIDHRPSQGEDTDLSGRRSPTWFNEHNEKSPGAALGHYYYHHVRGSNGPRIIEQVSQRPSHVPYFTGNMGPPPTEFPVPHCSSTSSLGDQVGGIFEPRLPKILQKGYDGMLMERIFSDHGENSSSRGELSSHHSCSPASLESCIDSDYFRQNRASSSQMTNPFRRRRESYAASIQDDGQSISTSLFVEGSSKNKSTHPYRVSKRICGDRDAQERSPDFSHDSYVNLPINQNRHSARRKSSSSPLTVSGGIFRHKDSKYSGASVPWRTSIVPKMTRGDEVSDASLQKRGLKRGQGDRVCKRGYGANDPENIAIVNMKERDGMSFQAIADYLNKQRVAQGRQPTLSVCGIAGRYNRTAPLLFASQGKIFVPLSERRTAEGEARHGTLANPGNESDHRRSNSPDSGGSTIAVQGGEILDNRPVLNNSTWDGELDVLLVQLYKEYDANRWQKIAKEFTDRTGIIVDAGQVALRHAIL